MNTKTKTKRLTTCLVFLLSLLSISACTSDKDEPSVAVPSDLTDDAPFTSFKGVWKGSSSEQGNSSSPINTRALFINDNVFILRDDKALYGLVTQNSTTDGLWAITVQSYTFTHADIANQHYTAQYDTNLSTISIETLVVGNSELVGNYSFGALSTSGVIELGLDNNDLSEDLIASVSGVWSNTDNDLHINDDGTFLGHNLATSPGCLYEGNLSSHSVETNVLNLEISRRNCPSFNVQNISGFALLDGQGKLEFYVKDGIDLLFMSFNKN